MKNFINIIISLSFLTLFSCQNGNSKIENFIGSEVNIPIEEMALVEDGGRDMKDYRYAHIVYLDSSQCKKCVENKYALWMSFAEKAYKRNPEYQMVFIVEGKRRVAEKLKELSYYYDYTPTVFYDSCKVFVRKNEIVGESAVYNSFIINEANKVKALGDPIVSESIEKFMLSFLERNCSKKTVARR